MNATLAVMAINAFIGLIYLGSTSAFSAFAGSVVCLVSISYVFAIVPHLLSGRRRVPPGWFFMKGWFGTAVHTLTCGYIIVFVVIFCFPYALPATAKGMNYTSVIIGGISIGIALLWFWKQNHGYALFISGASIGQIVESQVEETAREDQQKWDLVPA